MNIFACVFAVLCQDMIENTWKWAKDNNRIIKHPISGGEFVDIDVEHLKKVSNETGNRMTQSATTHYEDHLRGTTFMVMRSHQPFMLSTHHLQSHHHCMHVNVFQCHVRALSFYVF